MFGDMKEDLGKDFYILQNVTSHLWTWTHKVLRFHRGTVWYLLADTLTPFAPISSVLSYLSRAVTSVSLKVQKASKTLQGSQLMTKTCRRKRMRKKEGVRNETRWERRDGIRWRDKGTPHHLKTLHQLLPIIILPSLLYLTPPPCRTWRFQQPPGAFGFYSSFTKGGWSLQVDLLICLQFNDSGRRKFYLIGGVQLVWLCTCHQKCPGGDDLIMLLFKHKSSKSIFNI